MDVHECCACKFKSKRKSCDWAHKVPFLLVDQADGKCFMMLSLKIREQCHHAQVSQQPIRMETNSMSINIDSGSKLALALCMTERQNQQSAEIGLFDPILSAAERPSPNLQKIMQVVAKFKKNPNPVMEVFD